LFSLNNILNRGKQICMYDMNFKDVTLGQPLGCAVGVVMFMQTARSCQEAFDLVTHVFSDGECFQVGNMVMWIMDYDYSIQWGKKPWKGDENLNQSGQMIVRLMIIPIPNVHKLASLHTTTHQVFFSHHLYKSKL
ncbi:hypothetical protein ACJX0J_016611, partial [Zea mays]